MTRVAAKILDLYGRQNDASAARVTAGAFSFCRLQRAGILLFEDFLLSARSMRVISESFTARCDLSAAQSSLDLFYDGVMSWNC